VQDIFFVLTDTDHKSGFKLQSVLLARMFQLVELNLVQTPLFDPSQVSDPTVTNAMYLREYTANLLKTAFPHIQTYVTTYRVHSAAYQRFFTAHKSRLSLRISANIITTSTDSSFLLGTS
jgi:hypothetical protein